MATTLTLDVASIFANGVTLGAYAFYSESPNGVAPPVAATTTAVVSAGSVTFAGLADATKYWIGTGSGQYKYIHATTTPAAQNTGAVDIATTLTGRFRANATGTGLNGNTPVAKAAAITAPTAPSAAYVQAEAQSAVAAINAIRVALTNLGVTL